MNRTKLYKRLSILILTTITATPSFADLMFTEFGPLNSAGAIGDSGNTITNQTNNSFQRFYSTLTFSGDLTQVNSDTWASEARFLLTDSSGQELTVQPFTTPDFTGSLSVNSTQQGVFWGPQVGQYTVETFESFDDGPGVDAIWENVSLGLSGLPTIFELGEFGFGTNFIFDTFGSTFDTELGGFTSSGELLGNNDDVSLGFLQSLINLGELATGEYFLGLGGFNTTFFDYSAVGGNATGAFNINLNGKNLESGTFDGGVSLFRFTVTEVPEPSTLVILALGLIGLGARRTKK